MPSQLLTQESSGSIQPIDLKDVYVAVRRRLWLAAGIVVLGTLASAIFSMQMTDRYVSSAQLELRPPSPGVLESGTQSSENKEAPFIATQIEILRSRQLMERVVAELDLARVPEFNARIRDQQKRQQPIMAAYASQDAEQKEAVTAREIHKAVQLLGARIEAVRQSKSYLVTVSARSEDPARAAQIANGLIEAYLNFSLTTQVEDHRSTSSWLKGELVRTQTRLKEAETAAETFKKQHRLALTGQDTAADMQLGELTHQLALARADLAKYEARQREVRALIERGESAETIGRAMDSRVMADLRERQASLRQKQAEYSTMLGSRHPSFVALNSEIADLAREIEAEIARNVAALDNDLSVARSRVASLLESVETFEQIDLAEESALSQLAVLEGRVETERRLLNNLLEESRRSLVLAGQRPFDPVARQISEATLPMAPAEPNRKVMVVLGFLGSGVFAFGLVFLFGILDETFSTGRQLQSAFGAMNLATIPLQTQLVGQRGTRAMGIRNYLVLHRRSRFSEAFRLAHSNLVLLDVNTPPQVVMMASALEGEGKSTSAFCLAQTAALGGARTLLIDGDFRNPSLSSALVKNVSSGFVEVLTGQCTLEEAVVAERDSGLEILPLKEAVYAQPLGLNSASVQLFFDQVRQAYDFIILDSAPILPVGDAPILARWLDATVFAVKWEATPASALASALERVQMAGCPRIAMLLSQADLARIKAYGHGDDAYYTTQYGHKKMAAKKSRSPRKRRRFFRSSKEKHQDAA